MAAMAARVPLSPILHGGSNTTISRSLWSLCCCSRSHGKCICGSECGADDINASSLARRTLSARREKAGFFFHHTQPRWTANMSYNVQVQHLSIKSIIKILYSGFFGCLMSGILSLYILTAFCLGQTTLLLTFDEYGEFGIETILFPILFLCSVFSLISIIKKIISLDFYEACQVRTWEKVWVLYF